MNSSQKKSNFKRLASSRTNDILKKIKVLSNCSNRSSYEYTEEEINKIFSAIEKATKEARAKFYYPSNKKGFKL